MEQTLFTPAAVLDLLMQIDELRVHSLGVTEGDDGIIQIHVGNSVYELSDAPITDIPVDRDTAEQVEEINMDAYEALDESGDIELQPISSGIISELVKLF